MRALEVRRLGVVPYADALELQRRLVDDRKADRIPDTLLLLQHPHVVTIGVKKDGRSHILATPERLSSLGVEVFETGRGGDVTYHGPGQLVAYPIVRLADRGILLRPLVRALEQAMIDTAAGFGISAGRRDGYPGCWCDPDSATPRKLGALGLRVEGGVSYHGIALNVTTDLDHFALIDPCGLPEVDGTSLAREAGWPADQSAPSTASVANAADRFEICFAEELERASRTLVTAGAG